MKLYFANTSPYARKARIVVEEKGLTDQVAQVFQTPFEESPDLKAANPLGKVPALVRDDGQAVFDSAVICEYLNGLTPAPDLYDRAGDPTAMKTLEALTDGMLDAAFAIVMEKRRDEAQRSEMWLNRWESGILRAADVIEDTIERFEGPISIGQIGLGAALGYLDFRLPEIPWRADRPALAAWFEAFSDRPSMAVTHPPAA